jgi:hypothetical protein
MMRNWLLEGLEKLADGGPDGSSSSSSPEGEAQTVQNAKMRKARRRLQ